ncbi:MAG: hypothetical protein HY033_06020 [Ignavibacteriae bacterium]|nr:hypothetical protein [Ignavibacteria bacterium]MBI3364448.1 hypothetical protein [Ignavibacteriota bacterium]
MTYAHRFLLFFVGILLLGTTTIRAQNPFEDAVKQISSDNVRGYVQPFVNAFGANMNSGLYNSAEIGESGLYLNVRLVAMGTLIGDAEKTYTAAAPDPPYPQYPVQTATVFGDLGAIVQGPVPGMEYHYQNGQVKTSFVPFLSPQLTVGNIFGTQAVLRYVPLPEHDDFPKVTLFGIGVRHSISRYLPTFPADLAASVCYQKLDIGDIFSAKAFNIGAQISKSYSVATLYGGVQYETSTMSLSYTYTGSNPPTVVNLDIDGENKIRATAGLSLNLVILHLNADINVGKVTVASAGIGFGL